jgi:hypothetical protein
MTDGNRSDRDIPVRGAAIASISAVPTGISWKLRESAGRKGNAEKTWASGTGRDPVQSVRLPPSTRVAIQNWAKHQGDKPSRSEAIAA